MELNNEGGRSNFPFNKVIKYFGIIMALAYVVLGIAIMFGPYEFLTRSPAYSFPLGCLLVAYGFFRGYRTYQKLIRE